MILEIQHDPRDWYDEYLQFYDYFYKRKCSFSYIRKILGILNLWGFFLARKLGTPFFSIPAPRGYEKSRLIDAYFEKTAGRGKQSDPISPNQLAMNRDKFKEKYYNWIYLTVWLELRPMEVDQVKNKNNFRIFITDDGTPVLWVFQTKLVSVPPRFRWKLIPLFLDEQKRALEIIQSDIFDRPRTKLVKLHFGSNTTLYGGRKDFTDLMLSLHQNLENVSQWLGHSSIDRTWKHYKSKVAVHFKICP